MNEKLLQYLWNYKIFTNLNFRDEWGNPIEILDFGKWNFNAGPDFLLGKIKINEVTFVGNIELHVKSSDWIFHQHSKDPNYENIILHVVYQNDADLQELKEKKIPTLELRHHISPSVFSKYEKLLNENSFIACEELISEEKIPVNFHEENILKKLEEKSLEIEKQLMEYKNDYEAVLFHNLAYAFGLKVNAEIFKHIAESIDFKMVNKIRQNENQLESVLFGIAGWLSYPQEATSQLWKREFEFLKVKYKIPEIIIRPQFLRLRPPNFPTIRLSQLANLYFEHQNLFSKLIIEDNFEQMMAVFSTVKASDYWDDHFNFGKISPIKSQKKLSNDFIELIILNTVLPFQYFYKKNHEEQAIEHIIQIYQQLSAEKNTIVEEWKKLNITSKNALESQSLIYHYKNYCKVKNCLNCNIGFKILKQD